MPTTRAPLILAICPTVEPTAPAAPETTTVSPSFGRDVQQSEICRQAGHSQNAEIG